MPLASDLGTKARKVSRGMSRVFRDGYTISESALREAARHQGEFGLSSIGVSLLSVSCVAANESAFISPIELKTAVSA